MALNWTMLSPNRSPVPLPNEMTITSIDSGVELILHVPDAPPSQTAAAGGSGGSKTLKATGKLAVTDQRVRTSVLLPLTMMILNRARTPQFIFTSASDPALESLSGESAARNRR